MRGFAILTSRKRVVIALAHTVVFLGVAIFTGFLSVRPLERTSPVSAWLVAGIYVVVSGVLVVLTSLAGNLRERVYFGLCTSSAALGLCRQILGDAGIHAAAPGRPVLLACAVIAGLEMLRSGEVIP